MKEKENRTSSNLQNPPKSPLIREAIRSSIFSPPCGGGTFCEAKGGGAFGKGGSKKAFTLVELIIVITILAILATIAFVSFQGYVSRSRDGNRLSTMKNAEIGFEVFQAKSGVYPIQSTGAEISVGTGNVITRQGDFDLSIARVINMNEVPRDPKTQAMYNYISDTEGKGYKVLYYLENTPEYAFFGQTFADDGQTPVVKGQGPGVVLDSADEMVSEDTDLFGAESGSTFTVLVGEGVEIPGTGVELGGGFENFAKKGGNLDAPKTCPDGFIPVPGNAEFLQPGFCVMTYEATYIDAVTPDSCDTQFPNTCSGSYEIYNSVRYKSGKTVVSIPGTFPITNITQLQAIGECAEIGGHLILNNEWMTIARNIERVGDNWSSGTEGSGGIYRGITGESNSGTSLGCQTSVSSGSGQRQSGARALVGDTQLWGTSKGSNCDSKRQLKLSNGQVIWDLAGNVWEHVNARNAINGSNYATMNNNICGSGGTNQREWYSFSNSTKDTKVQCTFINHYTSGKYGPAVSTYNASNGVGNIRSYKDGNANRPVGGSVFIRGGDAINNSVAGIYAIIPEVTVSVSRGFSTGFRCAY